VSTINRVVFHVKTIVKRKREKMRRGRKHRMPHQTHKKHSPTARILIYTSQRNTHRSPGRWIQAEEDFSSHSTTIQDTPAHDTLQHTATHCNTPQYTATHCNTQATAARNIHNNNVPPPQARDALDAIILLQHNKGLLQLHDEAMPLEPERQRCYMYPYKGACERACESESDDDVDS